MAEIRNVGNGGDDRHIKLSLQTFLDDFHVQHPQKAAAKAKAQGRRRFGFKYQRRIVQLKLFHGISKLLIVIVFDRVNSRKNHGLNFFKAFDSFNAGVFHAGDGVTDHNLASLFDTGDNITHVPRFDGFTGLGFEFENANFIGQVFFA